ncbi:hypothetical protein HPB51_010658 [Rhipicephalus microplus]|uniref:Uncharacterized protein n=1 Tax=Rhipicephalus microplus TaxID=6941 RepID=A0A9J6D4X8_RHIMP|nr:hypothetical protein HPB51_010658 [Rhipicephalus microplus]
MCAKQTAAHGCLRTSNSKACLPLARTGPNGVLSATCQRQLPAIELSAATVLLRASSWPHYYASQTTHAHRLVAFGCVSSSEGDNFALDGLCLLHSNDSTWLLSSVTSPHVRESPAIRASAERDFTSGLGSSIPGMMLNLFRFVLQSQSTLLRCKIAEKKGTCRAAPSSSPASRSNTVELPSAVRRLARAHPAEPAPTAVTKKYMLGHNHQQIVNIFSLIGSEY